MVVRILRKPYRAGTSLDRSPSPTAPSNHGGGGQHPSSGKTNDPNLHLRLPPPAGGGLTPRSAADGHDEAYARASGWGWGAERDAEGSDGGALEQSDFSDIFTDSEDDTSATVTAQMSPQRQRRRQLSRCGKKRRL